MKQQDICIEEYLGEKQWLHFLRTINIKNYKSQDFSHNVFKVHMMKEYSI